MNTKLNTTFSAVTLVATLAFGSPANAQSPSAATAPSSIVRYGDLDLSTSAGIRTLYGRIQDAAWRVCQQIEPPQNGPSGIENVKCRQTLVDVAVGEVNKPALTALHTGKKPSGVTASR
jgi:UrcA family protein